MSTYSMEEQSALELYRLGKRDFAAARQTMKEFLEI